ncbi:carboxymuconolactone decarboxylase family protein [Paenibacillus baekrokdamisoli]|uniref:carboxymuconolactone decarboxylase family protein n=1 Tax=Paenibacillus baekrokdamisoli TaxID=1712516 RepID=UPI0035D51A11
MIRLRFNYREVNPGAFQAMLKFDQFANSVDIDPILRELIKIRVSQLNGCAFCIDSHTRDARKIGESEQRIYLLNAWRETTLFSAQEKAALHLAEAMTRISEHGLTDEVYEQARAHYNEKQIIDLIMIINVINSWNRIGVSMQLDPGQNK